MRSARSSLRSRVQVFPIPYVGSAGTVSSHFLSNCLTEVVSVGELQGTGMFLREHVFTAANKELDSPQTNSRSSLYSIPYTLAHTESLQERHPKPLDAVL